MENVAQIIFGIGAHAIFHPVACAKVLIQVGYEPISPALSTNLFGKKVFMYPNIIKYISYIRETDGFRGLYSGLGTRLISNFVNTNVSTRVFSVLTETESLSNNSSSSSSLSVHDVMMSTTKRRDEEDAIISFLRDTLNETLSRCSGIIVSQPFHVIFVRSVVQFVGREKQYSSILASVYEIWENDGIKGFFSGLVPRLLGEVLTIWLTNILTKVLNIILFDSTVQNKQSNYAATFSNLVVTQITYPFALVSNIMAVNKCRSDQSCC